MVEKSGITEEEASGFFKTEVNVVLPKNPKNKIFEISEAEPPENIEGFWAPLPENVHIRIIKVFIYIYIYLFNRTR